MVCDAQKKSFTLLHADCMLKVITPRVRDLQSGNAWREQAAIADQWDANGSTQKQNTLDKNTDIAGQMLITLHFELRLLH